MPDGPSTCENEHEGNSKPEIEELSHGIRLFILFFRCVACIRRFVCSTGSTRDCNGIGLRGLKGLMVPDSLCSRQ